MCDEINAFAMPSAKRVSAFAKCSDRDMKEQRERYGLARIAAHAGGGAGWKGVLPQLEALRLGTRRSDLFNGCRVETPYQRAAIAVLVIPSGALLYKGMPLACDGVLDSHDIKNAFVRKPAWYGDFKTALYYAERKRNNGGMSCGVFAFETIREVHLINLLHVETLRTIHDMLAEKATAARDAGDDTEVRRIDRMGLALIVATGWGMDADAQERTARREFNGSKQRRMAKAFTGTNGATVVQDASGQQCGWAPDALNRMSLMQVDMIIVSMLIELFPALDGYYAPLTRTLWHRNGVFHPEVCMFQSQSTLRRFNTLFLDACKNDSSLHLLSMKRSTTFDVTDDDIEQHALRGLTAVNFSKTSMPRGGAPETSSRATAPMTRLRSVRTPSIRRATVALAVPTPSVDDAEPQDYPFDKNIHDPYVWSLVDRYVHCGDATLIHHLDEGKGAHARTQTPTVAVASSLWPRRRRATVKSASDRLVAWPIAVSSTASTRSTSVKRDATNAETESVASNARALTQASSRISL